MLLGGGNAALDAAATCLKEGADNIHMVFRASRDQVPIPEEELKRAEDQGIHLYFQSALTKMIGEGSPLTRVEIAHLSLIHI